MPGIRDSGFIVTYSTINLIYRRAFADFYRDVSGGARWSHYFCGRNTVTGAECPNCGKKLTLLLTIDTSDPYVAELLPLGRQVPLLYCFCCALNEDLFFYRLCGSSVVIVHYARGPECADQPYSDFPREFPGCPARLLELSAEAQTAIDRINRGEMRSADLPYYLKIIDYPLHQIGGRPLLTNKYHETLSCVECEKDMEFLAAISDECLHPIGFTGDGGSQVIFRYCLSCKVIAAFAQSD